MPETGSDDVTFRGRMAPAVSGAQPAVAQPAGRVCVHEGCVTVLSIYNATGWCWQHEEPHAFVLQPPRKRRRDAKVA